MDSLQAMIEEEEQLEREAAEEQRRAERIARRRVVVMPPAQPARLQRNVPQPPAVYIVAGIVPNQVDRFWSRVDRSGECWEWQGPPTKDGYGQVSINKTMYRPHRLAYMLTRGPIPRGLVIRHTCDNRPCVNPEHLIPGTHQDNVADAVQRKRMGPGKNAARGERAGSSRLTDRDVIAIRATYAAGGVAQWAIAGDYGVTVTTISRIVTGKSWSHLPVMSSSQSSDRRSPEKERLRRSVHEVKPLPGLAKRLQDKDAA